MRILKLIFGPKTREEKDELLKLNSGTSIFIIYQPDKAIQITDAEFNFLIRIFGGNNVSSPR